MHFSAILVLTLPDRMARCIADLEALSGVEVHHSDAGSGRIIAVQESDRLETQQETLRRIQALPTVLVAELVYHYREAGPPMEEAEPLEAKPSRGGHR